MIGTHGRGFYVLDNIGVLRQATPELTNNALFVFEPLNPMRGRDRNVTFDYFLNKEASEVKIEFLDAQGNVLRSFTGTPKTEKPAGGMTTTRSSAAARRARPSARHQSFHVGHALRRRGRVPGHDHVGGPAAAWPARRRANTVRITANGETKSRDFNIAIDPRLVAEGIGEADLLEQFKLSLRVRDKVTEANQAVIDIRNLREQINQRLQKVRGAEERDPEAGRRRAGAAGRG